MLRIVASRLFPTSLVTADAISLATKGESPAAALLKRIKGSEILDIVTNGRWASCCDSSIASLVTEAALFSILGDFIPVTWKTIFFVCSITFSALSLAAFLSRPAALLEAINSFRIGPIHLSSISAAVLPNFSVLAITSDVLSKYCCKSVSTSFSKNSAISLSFKFLKILGFK